MPQPPSTLFGIIAWVVVIVVLCVAAVFLFERIILPILKQIT